MLTGVCALGHTGQRHGMLDSQPIDSSVHTAARRIRGPDQIEQAQVLDGSIRQRLAQPLVEAAARDVEHATHRRNTVHFASLAC